jgi:uncharacterized membrane protein YdbT with pleckstrin-like domain
MVSYVEKNLIAGERILYKTGLHWIVLVAPTLLAAFFAIPGLMMLIGSLALIGDKSGSSSGLGLAGFCLLLIGGLLVLAGYLKRKSTEMVVTNKRILIKTGLLSRRTFELLLSKVESIGVEEGILGRMLGYGSVVVRGTGGTPEPFKTVSHPLEFRRQVQQQIEQREQANQLTRPSPEKVLV